jgi:hypothetical protein
MHQRKQSFLVPFLNPPAVSIVEKIINFPEQIIAAIAIIVRHSAAKRRVAETRCDNRKTRSANQL